MARSIHPSMALMDFAMGSLIDAAREAALRTAKLTHGHSPQAYRSLRPGAATPLWNELRSRITRQLVKRGDKVLLARYLGVTRQRLHLVLKSNTAMPDGERTLLLLAWVVAREQGRHLG